jgi:CubicO group peptidase (beta-lactamase class C family)
MQRLAILAIFALTACHPRMTTSLPPPPPETTYAWATFDSEAVRDEGAAGIADRRTGRAVTTGDPARLASVSKLIVALGVMRLVEQGRIDLDADVSRHLGWNLRNPAFPNTPITLRMLLSHTSSLQDAGEAYVIPLGGSLREGIAQNPVFDLEHAPGTYFRYANLNFPVIGSVLEKATGERFDRLIHRTAIAPLGLDACFNWTMCSDAKVARAVTLYRANGNIALDDLQGARPACPVFRRGEDCDLNAYRLGDNGALFSPQGGFRASVRDLVVIGRLLLNRGRHEGRQYLSQASIDAILRPVWTFDGANGDTSNGVYCAYGLAAQTLPIRARGCNDDLFSGRHMVGHAGEAYNLRSGLWIDPDRRVGIAFFAANNPAVPTAARTAYSAIEEWFAAKLGD